MSALSSGWPGGIFFAATIWNRRLCRGLPGTTAPGLVRSSFPRASGPLWQAMHWTNSGRTRSGWLTAAPRARLPAAAVTTAIRVNTPARLVP